MALLNMFSIQERIPPDHTSWSIDIQIGEETGVMSCLAPQGIGGVPHGLDADIANAILDLFVEAGAPSHGILHTTPYQILVRANLHPNGTYYEILRDSLNRLTHSVYTIGNTWRDHGAKRWTSAKFSIILEFNATSADRDTLDSRATISITIAQMLVRSIREQYTKPVNSLLLNNLKRPPTRSLYRLLDAKRRNPETLAIESNELTVNLLDWAKECKFTETETAAYIKRLLASAHAELLTQGYLREVKYSGRGANTDVTYLFNRAELEEDPTTAALLRDMYARFALSVPNGRKLITQYGQARVQERVLVAQQLIQQFRPRSPAAFVTDVIKDEEGKYQVTASDVALPVAAAPITPPAAARAQPEDAHTAFQRSLEELGTEELLRTTVTLLQVTLGDRLTAQQYSMIRTAMEKGRLAPVRVRTELSAALTGKTLDQFAANIKALVNEPPLSLF
ncbi:replication initiator protein A (plasmid) [Deinococcus taeanensis]|uniref:replication initiator protein A n=1 Tax=Deinococcus taeanensis TaxID=2737050 RepID=UPI001CDC8810|nr:replication initiator protein A [Deinococcus taeanensis]UBV44591.1 replication initiator protein A [Deinococcus taeanensis]